jgi:two-component system sensor histidine kinase UhpB
MNTSKHNPDDDAHCLAAVMRASSDDIYLIDAATLGLVDANAAACANLQYGIAALRSMTLQEVAPQLSRDQLDAALADATDGVGQLHAELRRSDGSAYRLTLHLTRSRRQGQALIVAAGAANLAYAGVGASDGPAPRWTAIAAHPPGLVYQCILDADGSLSFPYLSDGCKPLLGLEAAQLQQTPELFLQLLLPQERSAYLDSMRQSAATLSAWNWEGRIWVAEWQDVKWINLRSTPHALQGGAVQWDGIMSNVSASRQEQIEVRQSRARLAELKDHLENVKEQERTRIAREIHDDLGGNLIAIKMALAMLSQRLPEQPVQLQQRAAYLDSLVDRSIDAVHRIALDLRPSVLDFGIVAALEWQIKEFEAQTGVRCTLKSNQAEIELGMDQATALFRIFQEALTNIAKHAQATRIDVQLARTRHHVSLKITDNGRGIEANDCAKPKSFGIRGMVERAKALGGSVTLAAAAGGGTTVAIKIASNTAVHRTMNRRYP